MWQHIGGQGNVRVHIEPARSPPHPRSTPHSPTQTHATLPAALFLQLLASSTVSDVQESIAMLLTCKQFEVDGAPDTIRKMLPLIFAKDQGARLPGGGAGQGYACTVANTCGKALTSAHDQERQRVAAAVLPTLSPLSSH